MEIRKMGGRMLMAFAVATSLAVAPPSVAGLIVESGILKGATGVDVGGTLYDVAFVDGTCTALFGGCDEVSDFDFSDEAGAIAASTALLEQVFIDSLAGPFDSQPELTQGCSDDAVCGAMIPFALGDFTAIFRGAANWSGGSTDAIADSSVFRGVDTSEFAHLAYALFTPSAVGAVPEPSTLATMLLGLGLLGGTMRSAGPKRTRSPAPAMRDARAHPAAP